MRVLFTTGFLLAFVLQALCQKSTLPEIQQDLQCSYQQISGHGYPSSSSHITTYDSLFRRKIAYYTSHVPQTLFYPFDSLTQSNDISIVTSDDSTFRIYSWDRYDGGSMHDFDYLFQYRVGKHVYSKIKPDTSTDENFDPGVYYTQLSTIKAADGKTCYIALGTGQYASMLGATEVKCFRGGNSGWTDTVRMIRLKSGDFVNSIVSPYNIGLNYPGDSLPNAVLFDSAHQMLTVPVVNHKNDSVTANSDVYRFNGTYFQYLRTTGLKK